MPISTGATLGLITLLGIAAAWLALFAATPKDSRTLPRDGMRDFLYGMLWLVVVLWLFL